MARAKTKTSRTARKRKPNASPFSRWVNSTGLTLKEIAAKLGVSVQNVSNMRLGNTKPGRESAATIEAVSGGAVPATSWDKRKRRAKASA